MTRETVTRKERDRQRRKVAKEEAAQFDKLVEGDNLEEADPTFTGTSLLTGEELFGTLADEIDKQDGVGGAELQADHESHWDHDGATNSSDQIYIEEPVRPIGPEDNSPWEAWVATQNLLWVPRKMGRVLMNELFKQPMRKPADSPEQMLRCLTGYLKTIIREAVRVAAKEAIILKDGSNVGVTRIEAPISTKHRDRVVTRESVLPDKADTSMSVMERELRAWGEAIAHEEFFDAANPDGVRLAYYLETLKKADGWEDGFVISSYDPAILGCLNTRRATLNDRIRKSRDRLKGKAQERADLIGCSVSPLVEWLELRVKEVAVPWFWSEKVPPELFGTVMDIIHHEKDPQFSCPFASLCDGGSSHSPPSNKCQKCPRN